MLREAGAAEVHFRVSSPPYKWPCFYGMDTGRRSSCSPPTCRSARSPTSSRSTRSRTSSSIGSPPRPAHRRVCSAPACARPGTTRCRFPTPTPSSCSKQSAERARRSGGPNVLDPSVNGARRGHAADWRRTPGAIGLTYARRGRRHRGGREGRRAHQGARPLDVPARGGRRHRRLRRAVRARQAAVQGSVARLVDRRRRHQVGDRAEVGRFDTIGIDVVAMSVDDIAAHGAEPLFFLDYISVGKLVPEHIDAIVKGVARGCRKAGCALLGGEMSEHPGVMAEGEFDLVGFAVGVVERSALLPAGVREGDRVIGFASPGLRSNGYSLARSVFARAGRQLDGPAWRGARHSLGAELLLPSVIYAPAVAHLRKPTEVHALCHVTGGGIPGNLARVLPHDCDAVVERGRWEEPRIFFDDPTGRRRERRRDGARVQPRPRHARGRSRRRGASRRRRHSHRRARCLVGRRDHRWPRKCDRRTASEFNLGHKRYDWQGKRQSDPTRRNRSSLLTPAEVAAMFRVNPKTVTLGSRRQDLGHPHPRRPPKVLRQRDQSPARRSRRNPEPNHRTPERFGSD